LIKTIETPNLDRRTTPLLRSNLRSSLKTLEQNNGIDNHIKHKLEFEWRNIYRRLIQLRLNESYIVSVAVFN